MPKTLNDARLTQILTRVKSEQDQLSEDIDDVKSAIDDVINCETMDMIANATWEIGTLSNTDGSESASNTRIRTDEYISLAGITALTFAVSSGYKYVIDWFNSDKTANKATPWAAWQTSGQTLKVPSGVAYVKFLVADTSDGNASTSYASEFSVKGAYVLVDEVNKVKASLNEKIADGYLKLAYLDSDGTQYFNTGVNPSSTLGFEIDFINYKTPSSSGYANLIGSRVASKNNDFEITTYGNTTNGGTFRIGNTDNYGHLKTNERQKISYHNGKYTVDGTEYSVTNGISSNSYPIFILSLNGAGTSTYPLTARIYNVKLFSDTTLVRDFVPAYKEETSEVGLYDLVNDVFYSNSATTKNAFKYSYELSADVVNQKFSAVGNQISALDEKIDSEVGEAKNRIKYITDNNPPFRKMEIELEMGGFDSDGEETEDATGTRWRTPNYIYVSELADTSITVPTGYAMYVCEYSAGNTFIERGTWGSGSSHNVGSFYSIRWTIVKSSWTTMTEEEANCVLIKQKIPWYDYNAIGDYPDYYDTQIKSVASSFVNDMLSVGANGDGFVFISDVHWNGNYKHSPSLIKYLKDNTNLDLILCGGDLIDRSLSSKVSQIDDMQKCVKAFKQIGIPFVTAMGNHERNSAGVSDSSLYLTANEAFSITQNPVNWMPLHYANLTGQVCFYLDRPATKTRVIFIDSGYNNIGDGINITADEISWVEDTIENVQTGWHIIIVVHSVGDYQSLNDPISESNPFVYSSGASALFTALDTLSATYNIEAIFAGHSHVDNNAETTGGIPIVWVNSDAKWQYHGMTQPDDGTVNAQCFDVVVMDYTPDENNKKHIYLHRVGRGSDRTISYGS